MRVLKRRLRSVSAFCLVVVMTASAHAGAGALMSMDQSRETSATQRKSSAIGFSPADAEAQEQGIVGFLEVPVDRSMLNALVGDEMEAGAPAQAALWPILIPVGILYLVWCITQCQCCENHYNNGGTTQNEPSCCGNCFSLRCGDLSAF